MKEQSEIGVAGVARKIWRHADYRSQDPEAASRLAFIKGLAEALLEHFGAEIPDGSRRGDEWLCPPIPFEGLLARQLSGLPDNRADLRPFGLARV